MPSRNSVSRGTIISVNKHDQRWSELLVQDMDDDHRLMVAHYPIDRSGPGITKLEVVEVTCAKQDPTCQDALRLMRRLALERPDRAEAETYLDLPKAQSPDRDYALVAICGSIFTVVQDGRRWDHQVVIVQVGDVRAYSSESVELGGLVEEIAAFNVRKIRFIARSGRPVPQG